MKVGDIVLVHSPKTPLRFREIYFEAKILRFAGQDMVQVESLTKNWRGKSYTEWTKFDHILGNIEPIPSI